MQVKNFILILLLVIQAGISTVPAQSKKVERLQKVEVVRKIIASKNYRINVDTYLPSFRDPIFLDYSGEFWLEIKNDSVFSNLLYLGKTDANIGRELTFQSPLEEYVMKTDRKGNMHIKFFACTIDNKYKFRVDVYSNGDAEINVTMLRYQNSTFQGCLDM